jgi:hypothetical protein
MAQSMFGNMYDVQSAKKQEDLDYGKLMANTQRGRTGVAVMGMMGSQLGSAAGSLLGGRTPQEQKMARIDEMMAQYPNPQTYEDYMAIAAGAKEIGERDLWKKAFDMAQDMKGTTSDQYLTNKRIRNEKALAIQQVFGPADSIEKKQELYNKLVSLGYGDSSITTGLASAITTLKASGFKAKKETRLSEQAETKAILSQEKKDATDKYKSEQTKYGAVITSGRGKDLAGAYLQANEPAGWNDEQKKATQFLIGAKIEAYDETLKTERGVTPSVAQNYYMKALNLPEVYNKGTANVPNFMGGQDAMFNDSAYDESLNKIFGRVGSVVSQDEIERYIMSDLIIPGVTKVVDPKGRIVTMSAKLIAAEKVKYAKSNR